ncbi:MAG: transglycosylase [Alphaproteobacteria bacterium]|nr:MAG: transglycosylase [Alphaproteobacteria bacterium]
MRAFFNLPFNKIIKCRPIDIAIFKWRDKGSNRAMKHNVSFFFSFSETDANLSRTKPFGKNAHAFITAALFFIGFSVLFTPFSCFAKANPVNRIQSAHAKALTTQALQDIEKGDWDAARKKIAQSKDPLASKIYHWLLLVNTKEADWTNQMFIRLSHFIRRNPEWPESSKMKVHAEGVMPETLSNAEVLAWYNDFPPKTPYGMGRYMDSLIIEGKRDQARLFLVDWWASTLTSRKQQKDIFKKYGSFLTLDAHKKRFDILLYRGYYDSARAIAAVLGQGYPALANARIALMKKRNSGLGALINKVPSYLQDDPGLLYERLHWRRKKGFHDGALEILAKSPNASKISNPKKWWVERHIMMRYLLGKGQYKGAYALARKHVQETGFSYAQAEWLTGWLALRFMHKPTEAYERFTALYQKVKTPVSKARAAYWAGRAAQGMKQKDLAQRWYKKAAEFQTVFYGQLAGAALSRSNQLPQSKLPHLSQSERREYRKNELVQVSGLFKAAGMTDRADDFLYAFLNNDETPKSYRFAAELVAGHGNFYSAVKIAKKATRKGLFLTKQSYPTITKQLTAIDSVEWALIHALIRQESMFDYTAKSPAGARGLMQLMPTTARETSKKINVAYKKGWLTSRPKYNILLGSAYMERLLERYDGSYPLAIAAYNAGPGRVNSWLKSYGDPRRENIDLVDWIELIPIYETRNYVQRVLENVYIYRLRLNNIQRQPKEGLHVAIHAKK